MSLEQNFSLGDIHKYTDNWVSRNGAVQMFFLTPNRNMFAEKFVKWERFLAVLREYIILNVT